MNVSITLDAKNPTVYTYGGSSTKIYYDSIIFNAPSLNYTTHTVNITVSTYTFPNGTQVGSQLFFDYAAVNDTRTTVPHTTTTSLALSTPPHIPTTSPSTEKNPRTIEIGVGSGLGGYLVVIVVISLLSCLYSRRKRRRRPIPGPVEPDKESLAPPRSLNIYPPTPSIIVTESTEARSLISDVLGGFYQQAP
jgi:hypothetical protein